MRLCVHEIFSVYSHYPRETRQSGEGCTCYVLLSVLQSNWGVTGDWFLCLCLFCTGEGSGTYRGWTFRTFQGSCYVGRSLLLPTCCSFYHCIFTLLDMIHAFHLGEERLRHSWGSWACVASIQQAQSFWEEPENMLMFEGFVWSYFWKLQCRFYKCRYTTKWHLSKTVSHVPVEVPNLWILPCVPLSFFSQLSLKPFPPALRTQPAPAQW